MTLHAKYALARSCIAQILNLSLTISTFETRGAERLVSRQDCKIFNLVSTSAAAVRAVVADERPIAKQ